MSVVLINFSLIILIKFHSNTHQSIALKKFYLKSVETNFIKRVVRPLGIFKDQWRERALARSFSWICGQTLHPITRHWKNKL